MKKLPILFKKSGWMVLCSALFLQFAPVDQAWAQKNIPSPKEHFGFHIGDDYQLANFTQTEAYFKKLAAASDRLRLVDIGETEEGRRQYMIVASSPENLKNLNKYKEISQKMGQAELSDAEAKKLAKEGKAVVWIDGGLHSTETVGMHQLIQMSYLLASAQDEETLNILDKTIILLVHANPDGQELVSNWYMRESDPLKRSTNIPVLYQKYIGHDNNRDFFMLNMKESQNLARQLFVEWIPQIMYNHHQTAPAGAVVAGAPYRDPFNYVFDPLVINGIESIGAAMNTRLTLEGKPGYTSKGGSVFSTWYNGGLRTTTYFHNIIGLLTEIIGSPTPWEIPLVTSRLIPNNNTPDPVLPQKWHFQQSIDYSISLNYAVLDYAARHSDEMLYNIYKMGKNSIERGSKDFWALSPSKIELIDAQLKTERENATGNARGNAAATHAKALDAILKNPEYRDARGYIIPANQADFPTAIKFLNALIRTGIIVQKASSDFEVKGKKYPAGSYVVKTNQAFRPHILDMFEPQDHPNDFQYAGGPPIPPYDAAGWTPAYLMNVQFDRLQDDFNGPFERLPIGELLSAPSTIIPAGGHYILSAKSNDSFIIVNGLLKQGIEVQRLTSTGDFYVGTGSKVKNALEPLVKKTGVQVTSTSSKPTQTVRIKPMRIGLWDTYGGSMPSGWIRWIQEQYGYDYKLVFAQEIDKGNLKANYDVLIFVGGAIPSANSNAGAGSFRGGNMSATAPDNLPAPYKEMWGRLSAEKSIPALRDFLQAGGKVVTIGSSANLAYHLDLPVRDAMVELVNGEEKPLPNEKYYTPGSVLEARFDLSNPSNWGMEEHSDIYFSRSPVFKLGVEGLAKGTIKPLLWFDAENPLRSGWSWGSSYLKDGIGAFEASVGKGKLVVFGPEITFRAQTHGTFKLLFNQLYQ